MTESRRILAVHDDAVALRALQFPLQEAGFEVELLEEPRLIAARAAAFRPHLVVMGRQLRTVTAMEAIRDLRSFTSNAHVPVAFLLDDASELEVMRAIWSGAVDVLFRPLNKDRAGDLHSLLRFLARPGLTPQGTQTRVENLLGLYRRAHRSGNLLLNPGTPFEGRAVFAHGELVSVEYGPLVGTEALEEMLWFEDGIWRFEGEPWRQAEPVTPATLTRMPRPRLPQSSPPAPSKNLVPRLAFVDDDPELRMLFQAQLGAAGFEVQTAQDGQAGVELVGRYLPDLILADIDMPRLDGWGMMRQLKADHRTREIPFVFYSGKDDVREALKAARAGAHDYLSKNWRSESVVQRMASLAVPQLMMYSELQRPQSAHVDLSLVGVRWLMRRLAQLKLTGRLEVQDDWGEYSLRVLDGTPFDAASSSSQRQAVDLGAVGALLVARGAQGNFTPEPVEGTRRFSLSMEELIQRTSETLNKLESQVLDRRLATGRSFQVDETLYGLFQQICSDRDLMVARALCEESLSPAQISQRFSLPVEEVNDGLKEMLRRRVIKFAPSKDSVPPTRY